MSTFLQLQDAVLSDLNLTTASASSERTRVSRYLNEGYRTLLADPSLGRIRDSTTTISALAGTAEYTVTASKILYIRDATNDLRLTEVSLGDLRTLDPGNDSTGNPTHYAIRKTSATTLGVRLWPIPSENVTLDVDILAAITDLSANGDVPVFASEFHHILETYARMREYEKMDDTRYTSAAREYTALVRQLRHYLRTSPTRATVQGGRPRGYASSLGPSFPDRQ